MKTHVLNFLNKTVETVQLALVLVVDREEQRIEPSLAAGCLQLQDPSAACRRGRILELEPIPVPEPWRSLQSSVQHGDRYHHESCEYLMHSGPFLFVLFCQADSLVVCSSQLDVD